MKQDLKNILMYNMWAKKNEPNLKGITIKSKIQ